VPGKTTTAKRIFATLYHGPRNTNCAMLSFPMPKEAPAGLPEIEAIFHPRSIAVVGASANPDTPGHDYLHSLQAFGYSGEIYPVNPRAEEILGLPSYPSLRAVPAPVDYVISCIPASAVLDLVDDCVAKGARALQLFTARFSETGRAEGAELERRLAERARAAGVRIIGPNCMGLLYPAQGISFRADMPRRPGKIGLLSQSGNLLFELTYFGEPRGLWFSKAVSYGNGIDLNESDFLEYFAADGETAVVGAYVEGVRDAVVPGAETPPPRTGGGAEGWADSRRREGRRLAHGGAGGPARRLGRCPGPGRRRTGRHDRGADRYAPRFRLHAAGDPWTGSG
jgi:predicted CoA-binding protein